MTGNGASAPLARLSLHALRGLPLVQPGDDLADILLAGLGSEGLTLTHGDLLVVAQKIVSKAEGRQVRLDAVQPGPEAEQLAAETDKDARLVQLILDESTEVLRKKPGVLIVRHRLGLVGANAGIDQSNIDHDGVEQALLLPQDPDASAAALRHSLADRTGVSAAVIVADSMNRPWRLGTIGGAIGSAGIDVLDDQRGGTDLFNRELKVTLINRADALAAAATLLMGETTEKVPAVLVRGLAPEDSAARATDIPRPLHEDMFR